jgi:hypothetical protein
VLRHVTRRCLDDVRIVLEGGAVAEAGVPAVRIAETLGVSDRSVRFYLTGR